MMQLTHLVLLFGIVLAKPQNANTGNKANSGDTPQATTVQSGITAAAAPNIEHYIVGGQEAEIGQFPWQVALSLGDVSSNFFCGGSYVVGNDGNVKVVTAAHCVDWLNPDSSISVTFNLHDRSQPAGSVTWTVPMSNVIQHRRYNSRTMVHDVAIIDFGRPVSDMVSGAKPICLASTTPSIDEPAYVSGWGTTSYGGSVTQKLMWVLVNIVPLSSCRASYRTIRARISRDMVCAGKAGKDACQGDSGGPLVVQRNGVWELVGIVSWGYGCAFDGYPGIYAGVAEHYNWLTDNL